jgi:AcrR family transcriptional regulator
MPRTVDAAAHAVRREAFVDAAERLIQTKGYEQMSVQDVLAEVGASRGALYHYFTSKHDLLDAVVQRLVERAVAAGEPVAADPGLTAVPKLDAFLGSIARWKDERSELLLALLRVWMSDDNVLVREKLWQGVGTRLTPVLSAIISQGRDEGVFTAASPEEAARVLVALIHGLNDTAVRLFFDRREGSVSLAAAKRLLAAYVEAMERILGVPAGTLHLVDPAIVERWFA